MADLCDRAQERIDNVVAGGVAAARSAVASSRASAVECVDCGDVIPEARRAAVAGVERCVECEGDLERVG